MAQSKKPVDLATVGGIVVAFAAILGGQVLEGGHVGSILQPTAAIIVFGGTFGAVALQFPAALLKRALRDLAEVFRPRSPDTGAMVKTVVTLAQRARREGLIAIERDVMALPDPFLRRGFEMAVDGTDTKMLRSALEMELDHVEEELEAPAKVLEAAGGYAPTVGILGAVLGLIHVMENLSDPSRLGAGIAVAFVATVYGVFTANILFLPMAGKMKLRAREKVVAMELAVEGVCAVADGENPMLIERKLAIYAHKRAAGESRTVAIGAAQALRAA
jgi:chemotaxis protein MotA